MINDTGLYCLAACPLSYIPDHSSKRCVTSLVNISKAQSETLSSAPLFISTAFTATSVASGGFSINTLMCLVAAEALTNMQFLNVNNSKIALTIYSGMASSYIPNWISAFNTLGRDMIIFNWGIFKQNQISSLYFDNFGDALIELLAYVGVYILAVLLKLSSKMEKLIISWTGTIYVAAFSFLVSNVLGKIQSQILFSILQIIRMDLFIDTYSRMSLMIAYFTMSISVGLIIYCFHKLEIIFKNKGNKEKKELWGKTNYGIQRRWIEKKYEFMFRDFKSDTANRFFFGFWVLAFGVVYILLIVCFQSVPVLQCLSVVVLVLSLLIFSAIIKPFKYRMPAFLHFFNFSCVLVVGLLNLALAIIETFNIDISGIEIHGWIVVSVLLLSISTNTLFSVGGILYEIYRILRKNGSSEKRNHKKKLNPEILPLKIEKNPSLHQPQGLQNSIARALQNEDAGSPFAANRINNYLS